MPEIEHEELTRMRALFDGQRCSALSDQDQAIMVDDAVDALLDSYGRTLDELEEARARADDAEEKFADANNLLDEIARLTRDRDLDPAELLEYVAEALDRR